MPRFLHRLLAHGQVRYRDARACRTSEPLAVARHQRHDGREVSARGLAADRNRRLVDAEFVGVVGEPAGRRSSPPAESGMGVLARVGIDRDDDSVRTDADLAAWIVARVEAAEPEPAAVDIEVRGDWAFAVGPVYPHGDLGAVHRDQPLDHRGRLGRRGVVRRDQDARSLVHSHALGTETAGAVPIEDVTSSRGSSRGSTRTVVVLSVSRGFLRVKRAYH